MQANGSTQKLQFDKIPLRDPRRRELIFQLRREHPSMKNWEIAVRADCTPEYVRTVLKKNKILSRPPQASREPALSGPEAAAQNPSWFVNAIETDLAGLRAALKGEPRDRLGREKPSTNLIVVRLLPRLRASALPHFRIPHPLHPRFPRFRARAFYCFCTSTERQGPTQGVGRWRAWGRKRGVRWG